MLEVPGKEIQTFLCTKLVSKQPAESAETDQTCERKKDADRQICHFLREQLLSFPPPHTYSARLGEKTAGFSHLLRNKEKFCFVSFSGLLWKYLVERP